MTKLTEHSADMLCTIIVLGYLKQHNVTVQYPSVTEGDAKARKEADMHSALLERIGALADKKIVPSELASQQKMPCIIAKTSQTPDFRSAVTVTDDFRRYIDSLMTHANTLAQPPRGAYIGCMSTVSSLFVVGPSDLDMYEPQYRDADSAVIGKAYEEARKATNDCNDCIRSSSIKPDGIALHVVCDDVRADYRAGNLFRSCHGMIRAMTEFATVDQSDKVVLEIAMGRNTSKVASCLPCSMFMALNGTPATATHLGRGDNWDLPRNCNAMQRDIWRKGITDFFDEGTKILPDTIIDSSSYKELYEFLKCHDRNEIPDIFREALTFEKSFLDRMTSSLAPIL